MPHQGHLEFILQIPQCIENKIKNLFKLNFNLFTVNLSFLRRYRDGRYRDRPFHHWCGNGGGTVGNGTVTASHVGNGEVTVTSQKRKFCCKIHALITIHVFKQVNYVKSVSAKIIYLLKKISMFFKIKSNFLRKFDFYKYLKTHINLKSCHDYYERVMQRKKPIFK